MKKCNLLRVNRILFLAFIAVFLVACSTTQKLKYPETPLSTNDATIQGKLTYPQKFKYQGNPLSRMHSAADPSAHVWGDELWVYTSQDRRMDSIKHPFHYAAMDGYHAFSTKDMVNWTNHGEVFNSSMLNHTEWGETPENYMWAPGAARKKDANGKWVYYFYYPHNNKFVGQRWITGVATAPSPIGPFTDQGPLKGGFMWMDPMVFVDDDGEAYIYSNSMIVAKLKPDMVTLAEKPRKIEYAPDSILNDPTLRFCEGLYMHKKEGVYYLSYSNYNNKVNQAFYATSNSPYGPFEWKGVLAPAPKGVQDGAQDHHSIIEFKGQWYYFYHIVHPNLPKYKESLSRIVCFDKLFYNPDGTIQKVIQTNMNK